MAVENPYWSIPPFKDLILPLDPHTYIHTCTRAHTPTHPPTHTHIHTHACTHTHTYIYILIFQETKTPKKFLISRNGTFLYFKKRKP